MACGVRAAGYTHIIDAREVKNTHQGGVDQPALDARWMGGYHAPHAQKSPPAPPPVLVARLSITAHLDDMSTWHGMTRHDTARYGMTRHDMA